MAAGGEQGEPKVQTRRKMIQKVRRRVRRENERIVKDFGWIEENPRSALGSFLTNKTAEECDFDMFNHITMGESRKLKRKMKKLSKKMPENKDGVFKEILKYKDSLYRGHEKKLFNSVNELQKRRDKRMKRMESNAKKRKAEVLQKNLERFE